MKRLVAVLAVLFAGTILGSAQSTISGIARDVSGGAMPNVTVEASSSALIEKSRKVTTDGAGRYVVADLRPGTYTVTFTLSGFKTVEKTNIEVPSNTTIPINAE